MKKNLNHLDERDRAFSPYRVPFTDKAKAIVADVLNQWRHYELVKGLRKRGRRESVHNNLVAAITALVADLMHRATTSEKSAGRVHVSRNNRGTKRTRYQAEFEGRPIVQSLDILATPEMAFAELAEHGDYYAGRESIYKAGKRLLSRIDDNGITASDLILSDDEEIVILKGPKDLRAASANPSAWLDYVDTDLSNGYRDEMRSINKYLAEADIDYSGSKYIDLTNRRQRRYFNNASFMEGGRLFGGFWLNELRAKQRKNIVIDGYSVVEPDFRAMMPSLAYANVGLTIPEGKDPYIVPGIGRHLADRMKWRTGIKRLMAALMFSEGPLKRWPKGVREENFPDINMTLPQIVAAIKDHHEPIVPLMERGLGHHFHFVESEIAVDVLLKSIDKNITALQVHDAFVVPHNKAKQVADIMMETFEEQTGQSTAVPVSPARLKSKR